MKLMIRLFCMMLISQSSLAGEAVVELSRIQTRLGDADPLTRYSADCASAVDAYTATVLDPTRKALNLVSTDLFVTNSNTPVRMIRAHQGGPSGMGYGSNPSYAIYACVVHLYFNDDLAYLKKAAAPALVGGPRKRSVIFGRCKTQQKQIAATPGVLSTSMDFEAGLGICSCLIEYEELIRK